MADLAKEIGRHLPYLRRYARAITGEQGTGDRTVKAALERLLAERPSDLDDNPRLALYRSLHDVLRGGQAAAGGAGEG
jgi:DNA-directed RNA polymerase specialized sigma24 family protein